MGRTEFCVIHPHLGSLRNLSANRREVRCVSVPLRFLRDKCQSENLQKAIAELTLGQA